jgi:hypothetical protein
MSLKTYLRRSNWFSRKTRCVPLSKNAATSPSRLTTSSLALSTLARHPSSGCDMGSSQDKGLAFTGGRMDATVAQLVGNRGPINAKCETVRNFADQQ